MDNYPQVLAEDGSVCVVFAPGIKRLSGQPITIVLDFSQRGKVIGIEIINFKTQTGKNSLGIISQSLRMDSVGVRYAYDEDSDSFNLQLERDRSIAQKSVQGLAFLNDTGQVLGFSAEWKSDQGSKNGRD